MNGYSSIRPVILNTEVLLTRHRLEIVKKQLRILVADRNRHIRDFVKRELSAQHHEVILVSNVRDILRLARQKPGFDLIIVDPYFPELDHPIRFRRVTEQIGSTPVVLHTYLSSADCAELTGPRVSLIEKNGNSIDRLKQIILNIQAGVPPFGTIPEESPSLVKSNKVQT